MNGQPLHFEDRGLSTKADPATRHEQLTKATRTLVAQTFYGQLLKQMRNSPFKSEMFSGGRGGEAFSEMFDQRISERMTRGSGSKLVNAIVRRMEGSRIYKEQSEAAKKKASQKITPLLPGGAAWSIKTR